MVRSRKQVNGQVEELTILQELERDRQRLNAATSELYRVTLDFRGGIDQEGELRRGVADQFQDALDTELIAFEERCLAEERKLPATDIRTARVNKIVREKHPDLWTRHVALEAQERSLRQVISGRKSAIGAAQSILRGERG